MILTTPEVVRVSWSKAHRIIRSRLPLIDLFEDIADPADWDAILSAEAKTNPRVAESVGMLDLVPEERRASRTGASWAMAPFTHNSADRPSRLSDGSFGMYYDGNRVEVAIFETIYHHEKFMAASGEAEGWTSDFRELIGSLDAEFYDITDVALHGEFYAPKAYEAPQALAREKRAENSNGILYQSVRYPDGQAVAIFWPDVVSIPIQGAHYSYFWNGTQVTLVKDLTSGDVFSVVK